MPDFNNQKANLDDKNLQQKIRRHRVLTLYKIIIAVIIFCAIVAGAYRYWTQIKYTTYEIKQEYEYQKSSDAKIEELGDTVLVYSKDGMSCIDSKGKTVWNQTYEIQNPVLRTCKNVVGIADYNGRNIYIANSSKILGTVSTTMPIRDFSVAANGMVAVVLDDSSVTGIYLYDTSGNNPVYLKTKMSNSGYPLSLDISDDGKQVAVSFLKVEAGEIYTSIAFYNFSAVGQNYTDNLVGGYGYQNQVVPVVSYMNNDTIFALGGSKLMFYQGSEIPVSIKDIWIENEIKSVFYDMNYVGLVSVNTTGETKYVLKVYNTSGNLVTSLPFNMEYQDIIFDSNGIVIYNETEGEMYTWKNYLKFEGLFKDSVGYILPTNAIDKFTLVTQDKIQNIQLK